MHNSFDEFIQANQNHCSTSRVANENGKRFEVVSNEKFTKVRIDGGVITSHQTGKCDHVFLRHSNNEVYFVELKGKDIQTAFEQIKTTIGIFEKEQLKTSRNQRFGFIISSKVVPALRNKIANMKQEFARDIGKELHVKNVEYKYPPK